VARTGFEVAAGVVGIGDAHPGTRGHQRDGEASDERPGAAR
jgi:hypothetical protein